MRPSQFAKAGMLAILAAIAPATFAQVSLTTLGAAHTESFDTLPASGSATWTNNSTIPGWFHARTGTGTTVVANNGASNGGNLYSYGTGAATDRALGSLGSGNAAVGNMFWGIRLQNNTGATITSLDVSYIGEQWRNSAAAAQTIAFSYLVGSPTVTGSLAEFQSAGTAVGSLDFTSPITGGTAGALDGNIAANQVARTFSITGLSIPNGTEIMLRWSDPDHTGADHGLSIDSFSVTPQGGAPAPNLSINDVSLNEANAGGTTFTFTVSLSAPAGPGGVTFDIATADGTAQDDNPTTEDADYIPRSLTGQTIPAGSSTYSFAVDVNGDTAVESNETFFVNITNITGATPADSQGQGTIVNDDIAPNLTIDDVTLAEGNGGSTTFLFTVSLSAPAPAGGVGFDIGTADGTAAAGSDYTALTVTGQSILAGSTTYSFPVSVSGDAVFELDEDFVVNLTNVVNANVVDGQGRGTIQNDEVEPTLSATPANAGNVGEGNAGPTPVSIVYSLSGPAQDDLTIDLHTADGSADSADYSGFAMGDTVIIPGGSLSTTYTDITVTGDTTVEPDETFSVIVDNAFFGPGRRAPVGVVLPTSTLTIVNDDALPMEFSIDNVSVTEGNAGLTNATFTVTLATTMPPRGGSLASVNFTTVAGSAGGLSDFLMTSGTLSFNGTGTQTINVPIVGDLSDEIDETFTVVLSNPSGATISATAGTGAGTILDDDAAPSLSIDSVGIAEGNAGTTNLSFTVALDVASGQVVTVAYATADGTATTGNNDYVSTSGTLTFNPGATFQTVLVPINGDTAVESNESFVVNLSAPTNATIAAGQGTGTITNDDASADLSITVTDSPDPVTAGQNLTYVVTLTNAGPSNADGAAFSLPLPSGTTFVSLAAPGGWNCTTPAVGANGTVTCNDGTSMRPTSASAAKMAVGTAQFTILANVDGGVAAGTVLTTSLTSSATTSDPNGANNTSTATTTVVAALVPSTPVPTLDRRMLAVLALMVLGLAATVLRRSH